MSLKPEEYSPSEAFAKEQEQQERQAELEKSRAELDEIHEQSRREAMDRPPPATVRAYQEVYGRERRPCRARIATSVPKFSGADIFVCLRGFQPQYLRSRARCSPRLARSPPKRLDNVAAQDAHPCHL